MFYLVFLVLQHLWIDTRILGRATDTVGCAGAWPIAWFKEHLVSIRLPRQPSLIPRLRSLEPVLFSANTRLYHCPQRRGSTTPNCAGNCIRTLHKRWPRLDRFSEQLWLFATNVHALCNSSTDSRMAQSSSDRDMTQSADGDMTPASSDGCVAHTASHFESSSTMLTGDGSNQGPAVLGANSCAVVAKFTLHPLLASQKRPRSSKSPVMEVSTYPDVATLSDVTAACGALTPKGSAKDAHCIIHLCESQMVAEALANLYRVQGVKFFSKLRLDTDKVNEANAATEVDEVLVDGNTVPTPREKRSRTPSPERKAALTKGRPLQVYVDGACLNNGRHGAVSGYGVFFATGDHRNESGSLRRIAEPHTNQRAELYAIVRALQLTMSEPRQVIIHSDSEYSIKCVTVWLNAWKVKGWKNASGQDVKNRDLIEPLDRLLQERKRIMGDSSIVLSHVRGHSGVMGNEQADQLARNAALASK